MKYLVVSIGFIVSTTLVKLQTLNLEMIPLYGLSLAGLIVMTKELQSQETDRTWKWNRLISSILVSSSGAILTWVVQSLVPLGPVFASSLLGLGAGLLIPGSTVVFFCGTFVGMASIEVFTWEFFLIAGAIAGFLWYVTEDLFQGVGGKLGTLAMVASWITVLMFPTPLQEPSTGSWILVGLGFVISVISGLTTFILHTNKYTNPVVASSIAGSLSLVFAYGLGSLAQQSMHLLAAMGFAASFVGMSSKLRISDWYLLLISLGFCSVLFFSFGSFYPGIGGKLGFIAFISVSASYWIKKGLSWIESQCTIKL
jgi:hypothetical protein